MKMVAVTSARVTEAVVAMRAVRAFLMFGSGSGDSRRLAASKRM